MRLPLLGLFTRVGSLPWYIGRYWRGLHPHGGSTSFGSLVPASHLCTLIRFHNTTLCQTSLSSCLQSTRASSFRPAACFYGHGPTSQPACWQARWLAREREGSMASCHRLTRPACCVCKGACKCPSAVRCSASASRLWERRSARAGRHVGLGLPRESGRWDARGMSQRRYPHLDGGREKMDVVAQQLRKSIVVLCSVRLAWCPSWGGVKGEQRQEA